MKIKYLILLLVLAAALGGLYYAMRQKPQVFPVDAGTGILEGQMTIGPICPVEREDTPCKPTPEMFAARKIFVYSPDRKSLITTVTPGADGVYSATLRSGDYFVDMEHQGIGSIRGMPQAIHVVKGGITTLDISVDTGIR